MAYAPPASALEVWATPRTTVARATAPAARVRFFMRDVLFWVNSPDPCDPELVTGLLRARSGVE